MMFNWCSGDDREVVKPGGGGTEDTTGTDGGGPAARRFSCLAGRRPSQVSSLVALQPFIGSCLSVKIQLQHFVKFCLSTTVGHELQMYQVNQVINPVQVVSVVFSHHFS